MNFEHDYSFINHGAKALLTALKERDAHTQTHSRRVVEISREIGRKCGLDQSALDILSAGAFFHDIGQHKKNSMMAFFFFKCLDIFFKICFDTIDN